eukprot:866986_1
MEDLELGGYLDPDFGVEIRNMEGSARGVELHIDKKVFDDRFPVKFGSFQRKLRDFHFTKVRNHHRGDYDIVYINEKLRKGESIFLLERKYPTSRRGRASRVCNWK